MQNLHRNLVSSMLVRVLFGYSVYNFVLLSLELITTFNIDAAGVGAVMAAYWVPVFFLPLVMGKIADKIGEKNLVVTGVLTVSLAQLIICLTPNYQVLLFGRFTAGLGAIFFWAPGINLTSKLASNDKISFYTSLIVLSYGLGTAAAMLIVPIQLLSLGWRSVFASTAFIGFTIGVVIAKISVDTPKTFLNGGKIRNVVSNRNIIKIAIAQSVSVGSWATFLTFYSTYLILERSLTLDIVSLTLILASIGGIFSALIGGYYSDKKSEKRKWIYIPILCLSLSFFILDLVSTNTVQSIVISILIAASVWLPQGSIWALPKILYPNYPNSAMSLLIIATGLTCFAFPLIFGLIVDLTGEFFYGFLFLGAALLITSIISYHIKTS